MKRTLVAALFCVAAAGAGTAGHYVAQPSSSSSVCHYRLGGVLPDPVCTPGATNPDVTPATLNTTICKSGWTKTVRPPSSVTGRMKLLSMKEYGVADKPAHDFEYDHLISLQLGGAPEDTRNLFPEPYTVVGPANDARDKDVVESRLKREVCAGRMPLGVAQRIIATDWRDVLLKKLAARRVYCCQGNGLRLASVDGISVQTGEHCWRMLGPDVTLIPCCELQQPVAGFVVADNCFSSELEMIDLGRADP